MARVATMTTEQCEQELGPRGSLHVNSNNRAMVRKWIVANQFPAAFVGGLSMAELAIAYNSTDGSGLDKLRRKLNEARECFGEAIEDNQDNATTATAATDSNDVANQLAALIAQLTARPAVDANAVNKIIEDKWRELPDLIARYSPVTTIRIERQDSETKTVEGHSHPMLADLITAMSSRQENGKHPNIMLVGPTGSGKTHGVEQAARALGLEFYTNGAISMDHQLIGFKDAAGNYHETPLRKAFGRAAVYLFDEIDSSDNSALLCLAGALANSGFSFPDAFIERHPDSVIIAAGNTWGNGATSDFVGRNKLDGAIKSRFPVRIQWDYDEALERQISGNIDWACRVQRARHNARQAGLKVIIDPRMTQAGAALIASGMSEDKAAKFTYLADLSDEQRQIIEAR